MTRPSRLRSIPALLELIARLFELDAVSSRLSVPVDSSTDVLEGAVRCCRADLVDDGNARPAAAADELRDRLSAEVDIGCGCRQMKSIKQQR